MCQTQCETRGWGPEASLRGSIQSLTETVAVERARADLAERKLTAVLETLSGWERVYGPGSWVENVMGEQSVTIETAVKNLREVADRVR